MQEYFLKLLSSDLVTAIQSLFIIASVVAFISIIIVQAIKKIDEKVFINKNLSNLMLAVINGVVNLIIAVIVVIVFDGIGAWWKSILYGVLIWLTSWATSVILYDNVMNIIFDLFEVISIKVKKLKE